MIIVRCLFLMLFATCFYGSNALAADFTAPLASHNFFTPELKPSPDSFKLAKSTFLPETYDDLGLSGSHNTKYGDYIEIRHCFPAYPLKTCPIGAKCDKCPVGPRYRCQSPSILSGENCICPAAVPPKCTNDKCVQRCSSSSSSGWLSHTVCVKTSCEPSPDETECTIGTLLCDNGCCQNTRKCCIPCSHSITTKPANSSYVYSSCKDSDGIKNIQTGWKCNSGYHKVNEACVKDCNVTNCAGYTLTSCPANATCSSCTKTAANCSTDGTMYRLDSCAAGYSKSGDACIEKNDTSPNGTTENMKVVVNFAKSCPAGLSFKMTPQGGSAVTCSSSQCYEYDVSNYPYAPDGIHSNETESIVTAGTQINLSSIPSAVSDIKSVSKKQTYSVSGTTYSFNVNDRATVIAGVGQNTDSGLGAYDFWTLQCDSGLAMLGDILYSDMTTGRPENHAASGKKAIGVVVYDGLALALNKSPSTLQWGSGDGASKHNPYLITCTDPSRCKTSGKQATDNILKYGAENNYSFPAAEYCNDYIVPGTSAGAWWHLPSIAELNSATYSSTSDARRVVNDTLSLVGGQILGDDEAYWTSDEAQASGAYMLLGASKWTKPYTTTESLKSRWFSHGKYESAYVRPFINYKVTYTPLPVLYSDMTTAYEIIEDKDPIGVVFDETRRLAVALDETAFEWSALQPDTDISTDSPLTDFNGAANTEYYWNNICKKRQVACPPFYYVKNYNVIRSDWYLPAYGELNEIYNKKTDINETMSLLNATPLSSGRYWSSSQTTGELGMYLLYMPYGQRLYSDEFGGASVARAVINY